MASFDFEFRFTSKAAPIVQACLMAARRRARALGISWRQRTRGDRVHVMIDGNTRQLDILGERLERDLPLVAEGVTAAYPPARRRQFGLGVADMYLRGRDTEEDGILDLHGVTKTRYWFALVDEIDSDILSPNVQARLIVTNSVVVGWHLGDFPPEVVLEELHAACELVLDDLFNRRSKKLSFAQLLDAAEVEGAFQPWHGVDPPVRQVLEDLKDLRKSVRHRAASGAAVWTTDHADSVTTILERLIIFAGHRQGVTAS